MNKVRFAARLALPALAAAAVIGGGLAPASAEPVNPQQDTRELAGAEVLGDLLGGGLLGGNLLGGLLGGLGG